MLERHHLDNAACARLRLPEKWELCPTCIRDRGEYVCPTCQGQRAVLSDGFQRVMERLQKA